MSKAIFTLMVFSTFLVECQTADLQNKRYASGNTYETTHFNLIFAPDLSNRIRPELYKRALSDTDILAILTKNLYPNILRYKRAENQLDKFRIDFVNKGQANLFKTNTDRLILDFGQFHTQNERIAYIMRRAGSVSTLQKDTTELKNEFNHIYDLAIRQPSGSDIWSYFHLGIDEKKVLPPEPPVVHGSTTYLNTFRNILILTTDGYIESGIYDKGFDLSQNTVNQFRKVYNASGEKDLETFFRKSRQFRIKPVDNPNLSNLEVLVLEVYDRSLTREGTATIHPTDIEIIRIFWKDWLQQCKVKRCEVHSCAESKYDAEKIILDFIGINKKNQGQM